MRHLDFWNNRKRRLLVEDYRGMKQQVRLWSKRYEDEKKEAVSWAKLTTFMREDMLPYCNEQLRLHTEKMLDAYATIWRYEGQISEIKNDYYLL